MFRRIFSACIRFLPVGFMLVLFVGGTVYYLILHRNPFTQNAFVSANIRVVSPLVSGYIESVHVVNNQRVRKGDPLITIYRPPYELKVLALRHSIAAEKANLRALQAAVRQAEAEVNVKKYQSEYNHYLHRAADEMYRGAATSLQNVEQQLSGSRAADAARVSAEHALAAAVARAEQSGETIRSLEKQLENAEIELEQTVVRAQCDGTVVNMHLSPGAFAAAGTALFACVDESEWFVLANFQETELPEIHEGAEAEIRLWQYAGLKLRGKVGQIGWGVERRATSALNAMPEVASENEWFLLPQRYPVQILLDTSQLPEGVRLHPGGSAFVRVKTEAHPLRQFIWRMFQI